MVASCEWTLCSPSLDWRTCCHLNWIYLTRAVHVPTGPCTVLREVSTDICSYVHCCHFHDKWHLLAKHYIAVQVWEVNWYSSAYDLNIAQDKCSTQNILKCKLTWVIWHMNAQTHIFASSCKIRGNFGCHLTLHYMTMCNSAIIYLFIYSLFIIIYVFIYWSYATACNTI